jgi:hypothetical protein
VFESLGPRILFDGWIVEAFWAIAFSYFKHGMSSLEVAPSTISGAVGEDVVFCEVVQNFFKPTRAVLKMVTRISTFTLRPTKRGFDLDPYKLIFYVGVPSNKVEVVLLGERNFPA